MSNTYQQRFSSLPKELQVILKTERETLPSAVRYLEGNTPEEAYSDPVSPGVLSWETVGLFFLNLGRLYEAIPVFKTLYEHLSRAQKDNNWIHKGMPLVWIRDCHRRLGHRWHAEKYLLLTLIEDSIREQGKITPAGGGIYHRFCWENGRPHEEFEELARRSWEIYESDRRRGVYPEYVLQQLGLSYRQWTATTIEADYYDVNRPYSELLLKKAKEAKGSLRWQALEDLAGYLLSCIPGFQIERGKTTKDYHFDGFIRMRGTYQDFRSDLGLYLLVECKNWEKPIGPDTLAYFAQKLAFHDCRAGIIFSKSGITEGRQRKTQPRFGALTVLKSYHHSGRIIMVLNLEDFSKGARGESLISILQEKYEQVRFDLPR